MAKSKYPQQLDTSIELPPVRENILEVGSEVINSLRSAIFNIEKTLGINPQGAVGNSIAERLNKALDPNGNIKADAISKANFLTGPIIDSDVSRVAGIQEDKLRLDFPTRLLQSEISALNSSIESIIQQVEGMSLDLSVHINPNSLNRHPAAAISTQSYTSSPSDLAPLNMEPGNVQTALQNIYSKHINYSGNNISTENKSHSANQIYFDNTDVSLYISTNDTQSAIEQVAEKAFNPETIHQDIMHSNGILRSGYINTSNNAFYGNTLFENVSISFSASTSSNLYTKVITINDIVNVSNLEIEKSDILTIYSVNNTSAEYSGDYEIIDYSVIGSSLTSITIIGNIYIDSDSTTVCKLTKRLRSESNLAGLLVSAREEAGLTSCRSLQICHPNASRVISSGINPLELSLTKKYIGVSINEEAPVVINLLYIANTVQTIDTVVSSINKQCAENGYNFLAYRLDNENSPSELVIACNIADFEDEKYTIKISRENDDGIDAAGFSYIEDLVISSEYNTNYFILGKSKTGLNTKVDSKLLTFSAGSTIVNTSTSGINFISAGVKPFDILTITGSLSSSNNKTFLITDVFEDTLVLSTYQLPSGFSSDSADGVRYRIYENIVSFNNFTFDSVSSSTGATLLDIYMDQNKKFFINKRFEYKSEVVGTTSKITLVDFSGDIYTNQYSLDIIKDATDGHLTLSLDNGTEVDVYGESSYVWITSGNSNVSLKFYIPDVANFLADINIMFYAFDDINNLTNLFISRVPYDNYVGRIVGGSKSGVSVSKLSRGIVGSKDISTEAITNLIELPRSELRGNGVIYGLEITNPSASGDLYSFDIQAGVCYINGKRFEISEKSGFKTNIKPSDYDKIFIGLDHFGNVYIQPSTPSCASPFEQSSVCTLAAIEYSSPDIWVTDLRLFIDNIDLKLLNAITVSPQPGMAHFTDFGKAIKYARKFSELYPRAGTPSIHLKSGRYYSTVEFDKSSMTFADWLTTTPTSIVSEQINKCYDAGLVLDFPVHISGEGDSTELILRLKYIYSDITNIYKGSLISIGKGYTGSTYAAKIYYGVISISNLKMNNSKVSLFDMLISEGPKKYPFSYNLENITFDNQNFDTPNALDNFLPLLSVALLEVYNTSGNKGNLSINNCRFIPDSTATYGNAISISNASRTKNISITNNKLYNSTVGTCFLNLDIVTDANSDSGSNILLLGNMAYGSVSSSDASRASIYSASGNWSDRISKDLYIGGSLFSSESTGEKILTWDLVNGFYGGGSPHLSSATFGDILLNSGAGGRWRYLNVGADGSNDYGFMKIEAPVGSVIDSITLGVEGTYGWTITIYKLYLNGSSWTTVGTAGPITASGGTTIKSAQFSNLNITVEKNYIYSAQIKHNHSAILQHYYLLLKYTSTDFKKLLGVY